MYFAQPLCGGFCRKTGNAPLSVWQTDGIIGENGQGLAFSPEGEGAVLPVEEGCAEVSVSPEGTVSVRREG